MTQNIYLALGSNMGDRLENLRAALAAFPPQIRVLDKSRVYETEPWGYVDQSAFLNMAVHAETDLTPADLLSFLKILEADLGRIPNFRNGPRLIDLDIIFFDALILDIPGLVIPHARMQERAFVLIPLLDIAPDFVHPVLGMSVSQLARQVDAQGITLYEGVI